MRKVFATTFLFVIATVLFAGTAFVFSKKGTTADKETLAGHSGPVEWMEFDKAMELNENKKTRKKLFLDIYTDWCGWCKRMDKRTFSNKEVAKYLNEHYHPVKLDAESKDEVFFQGKFGTERQLARSLGVSSYPTIAYLTSKGKKLSVVPGYRKPGELRKMLEFFAEEHYKTTSWKNYKSQ